MSYDAPLPQPSRVPSREGGRSEAEQVKAAFDAALESFFKAVQELGQPSAWDLIAYMVASEGSAARWLLPGVLEFVCNHRTDVGQLCHAYAKSLIDSPDLQKALCGTPKPGRDVESAFGKLISDSAAYRNSKAFREMVSFMAKFREYAPFNNMLVKLQNPACSFFATEKDWLERYGRTLKLDARPMLILAPMHPVMLVFDIDQTEGPQLPEKLLTFATTTGSLDPEWLRRLEDNALNRDHILIESKHLSSTNAGFATEARGSGKHKMRIVIHDKLDPPSRFAVLCHELAHIFLGHLGADADGWWPARRGLSHRTVEIEAESAAYIVCTRLGLKGTSSAYLSSHLPGTAPPKSVSLDLIAKVAGRIENMTKHKMPSHRKRKQSRDINTESELFA
jgi:hypothetical protein